MNDRDHIASAATSDASHGLPLGVHSRLPDGAGLRAAHDLACYAAQLRQVAVQPYELHWSGLYQLRREWCIYVAERNPHRWDDALFHLVNRSYLPWRGHQILFSREELLQFGVDDWSDRATHFHVPDDMRLVQADDWRPRRRGRLQLSYFADLLSRIAQHVQQRARTGSA